MGKGGSESMYGDAGEIDVKSVSVGGGTPKQALVAVVLFVAGLLLGVLLGGSGVESPSANAPSPTPVATAGGLQTADLNTWGRPKVTDIERENRAMESFDDAVVQMLAGMTLEQKVGQTTQFNIDETFNSFGNNLPTDDGQPGFADQPQFTDAPWDLMDEDLVRKHSLCSLRSYKHTLDLQMPEHMQLHLIARARHADSGIHESPALCWQLAELPILWRHYPFRHKWSAALRFDTGRVAAHAAQNSGYHHRRRRPACASQTCPTQSYFRQHASRRALIQCARCRWCSGSTVFTVPFMSKVSPDLPHWQF